ncbi:MAG: hypothetical protein FJX76_13525 [Armatimonadetes bacterium]|nr:hypothetical protein [Armatimonadota bacterium]
MLTLALPAELETVRARLEQGRPLDPDLARTVLSHPDVLAVGALAEQVALRKWGRAAHYSSPLRLPLSPTCSEGCPVCAALAEDAAEVHLIGDPLSLEDCEQRLRALRERRADAWIAGLAPAHVARLGDPPEVLKRLQAAGLDALLGSDEEMFTDAGRKVARSDVPDALSIHEAAHRAGLVSTATIRYGPSIEGLLDQLLELRAFQARSAGFSVFAAVPEEIETGSHLARSAGGYEDIRMVAAARLILDNIPHVRVPWTALGLKMGQVALSFGADDLGWVPLDPHVKQFSHPATFLSLSEEEILRLAAANNRQARRVDGAWRPLSKETP